jgi:hypothetical protein
VNIGPNSANGIANNTIKPGNLWNIDFHGMDKSSTLMWYDAFGSWFTIGKSVGII